MDFDQLTLTQAAAELAAGKITSHALTSEALARAKANADLNAFVTLDEEGALKAAVAFDTQGAGAGNRPLGGVPIVIKDNIEVAGLPCTAGTPGLKTFIPGADAPVVAKLRAAGAVIIGKTNMHELAFGISGYNSAFKTGAEYGVRNAYDRALIAGGSVRNRRRDRRPDRGGRARHRHRRIGARARRAERLCLAAADRRPLSASRHRSDLAYPRHRRPDGSHHGGCRAARSGHRWRRCDCAGRSEANPSRPREEHADEFDGDTDAAFQAALARLKAQGVTVIDIEMPELAQLDGQVGFPIALYEAYDDMVAYLKRTGTGVTIDAMVAQIASPDVKGTYEGLVLPRKLPAPDGSFVDAKPLYDEAINVARPALQALYQQTFANNRLDASFSRLRRGL